jgi:hypothetical protein
MLGAWWFVPTYEQPTMSALVPTAEQPTMSDYASGKIGVTVAAPDGGFRAVFPSQPQLSTDQSGGLTLTTYTSTLSDGGVTLSVSPWPSDFSREVNQLRTEPHAVANATVVETWTTSFDGVPAIETLIRDPRHNFYDEDLGFITATQWFTVDVTGLQNPPPGYRRFVETLTAR